MGRLSLPAQSPRRQCGSKRAASPGLRHHRAHRRFFLSCLPFFLSFFLSSFLLWAQIFIYCSFIYIDSFLPLCIDRFPRFRNRDSLTMCTSSFSNPPRPPRISRCLQGSRFSAGFRDRLPGWAWAPGELSVQRRTPAFSARANITMKFGPE